MAGGEKGIQQNEQGMTELVLEESGWYTFLVTGKAAVTFLG